jgi:hypothetical protein
MISENISAAKNTTEICHLKKKVYTGGGKKKVNYFTERIPGFSHSSF